MIIIFLEFATYNVNINVFVVATIVAEFIPGGGIRPYTRIDPIRELTLKIMFMTNKIQLFLGF